MKQIRQINLELGHPTVDEALRRLESELCAAKAMRAPVLKIIHGYGSSGKGGRIRTASRAYLRRAQEGGKIRDVICGEDFSLFNDATRRAFCACDALRQDRDLDNYNNGVTFVIL
ncbi:MAG: Smr/MutS family protein [Eubacteriales bacterium]|nr:Smr/MutS family protein [Eubacteriales bacterium]